MMRTIPVGRAQPEHLAMHAACAEALEACHAAFVPGNLVGDVFDAHAQVMDDHGYQHARLNACGYSMGTTFCAELDGLADVLSWQSGGSGGGDGVLHAHDPDGQ
jgi:Xaa-Pro aminopeptidase